MKKSFLTLFTVASLAAPSVFANEETEAPELTPDEVEILLEGDEAEPELGEEALRHRPGHRGRGWGWGPRHPRRCPSRVHCSRCRPTWRGFVAQCQTVDCRGRILNQWRERCHR